MQNLLQTLWAVIGLFLTTGATFLQAYTVNSNLAIQPINVSLQIGAVLITGCVGGKYAGMFSQLMYLFLGLTDYGVFFQGGGFNYLRSPAFGYLLGFVPAGWLCGYLAFKDKKMTLPKLTLICTFSLAVIHVIGLIYLMLLAVVLGNADEPYPFQNYLIQYSIQKLPSQFLIVCAAALISFVMRFILLY